MKTTKQLLKEGYYKGFSVKKIGSISNLIGEEEFEVWDKDCRCVQQLNPAIFDTEEFIFSNSLLDDNHRLVQVDYENKVITDIEKRTNQ